MSRCCWACLPEPEPGASTSSCSAVCWAVRAEKSEQKNFLMTPGILNCGFWWLLENGALGREIPLSFKQNDLLSLGAFRMVFI